ncbi:N-6 DNA methylase, partial [Enterococcus faecium]|nr:N-6 DNA methylase [Enterococcus faecium]MBJ0719986.1 N-6 DNA methylase [Enterococcus faecium]MBJ1211698.1 N-6 DNA methylase [Enterococcus faecium]MBK0976251.1 N-6 DNA methylase [Enterococcus faecium]
LKDTGVMAIVLPHGVLFRGGAEGKIRKALLENGAIDTVIGLPANIFFNTSIPTTVIILKKDRAKKDVLFIDASQDFEKIKTQNTLRDYHIDAILEAYKTRTIKDKYAYVAEFDEIVENDYNLNIPRYVDTFEEEEVIPLDSVSKSIQETKAELAQAETELFNMLKELNGTTEEAENELQAFISQLMTDGDNNE